MDIRTKLKYIKEGYSFDDIITVDSSPKFVINEMDNIFLESFTSDIDYIIETVSYSSSSGVAGIIGKIFKWLRDKVMQFVNFIKQKFSATRKGTKEAIDNVKAAAHDHAAKPPVKEEHPKIEDKKTHQVKTPKSEKKPESPKRGIGALEYRPDEHRITVLSKIMTNHDYFEVGFKKVYNLLSVYIQKLEQSPGQHAEILSDNDMINTKPFLDKIFHQALSINFDKNEIFKKLYGEPVSQPVTVQGLVAMTEKLEKLDNECQVFADWIQKHLPEQLEKIESTFQEYTKSAKSRFVDSLGKDEADRIIIDQLTTALNKIVKLINMEMSVLQVFAHLHAEVFMAMRNEVENFDWVLNPTAHDYEDDEDTYWGNNNDSDDLIH